MVDEPMDPTVPDDELLAEAARLRGDLPEPEPTAILEVPVEAPPAPTRTVDPGALLVGIWFMVAGFLAATLGDTALDHLPAVVVPASFAVVGLGLLIPKRTVAR